MHTWIFRIAKSDCKTWRRMLSSSLWLITTEAEESMHITSGALALKHWTKTLFVPTKSLLAAESVIKSLMCKKLMLKSRQKALLAMNWSMYLIHSCQQSFCSQWFHSLHDIYGSFAPRSTDRHQGWHRNTLQKTKEALQNFFLFFFWLMQGNTDWLDACQGEGQSCGCLWRCYTRRLHCSSRPLAAEEQRLRHDLPVTCKAQREYMDFSFLLSRKLVRRHSSGVIWMMVGDAL